MNFIAAGTEYCTLERHVPAPYLRRAFTLESEPESAKILVCGLGFYELFVNGKKITKGALAPYISSPDDLIYYDLYDVKEYLRAGENVVGLILGNGFQNPFGGEVWDFDLVRWRGAPKAALRLDAVLADGTSVKLESDENFKTAPSPIYFDDLRCGEFYDARLEQDGWCSPGFDDSTWKNAIPAPKPRGEALLCDVEPIVVTHEIEPVSITKHGDGYLYDFGVNAAGVCRLTVTGEPGQKIVFEHAEHLKNGKFNAKPLYFEHHSHYKDYCQKDIYICRGGGKEVYVPSFTYHGFRYVLVHGITEQQATKELLTYLVMNSGLEERGDFECSDSVVNELQKATRRATLANFYYIPTDCPHREKNGWTGDAAVSVEHMLINLSVEKSLSEWLRNIRKAQAETGKLPGIVPTGGWGFVWGNGPAWDCALTYLPYYIYIYRGDKQVLKDNAAAIFRYLHYLSTRIGQDGLVCFGLGDWCPPGRAPDDYKSPLEVTDSIISMDICKKAAFIFDVLGMREQQMFADALASRLRSAIRARLIDFNTMSVLGNCQTSQAMGIYYDVFEEGEKPAAFSRLLEYIDEAGGLMDTGILGARVIFHVLTAHGRSDIAYKMITTDKYPSYGNWIARGATTLWEMFYPDDENVASLNHHFFGDISSWFIQSITGIRLNPNKNNVNEVHIRPSFIDALSYANGYHIAPAGRIEVKWKRSDSGIDLTVEVPDACSGYIMLENGFVFENETAVKPLSSGTYRIVKRAAK